MLAEIEDPSCSVSGMHKMRHHIFVGKIESFFGSHERVLVLYRHYIFVEGIYHSSIARQCAGVARTKDVREESLDRFFIANRTLVLYGHCLLDRFCDLQEVRWCFGHIARL